MKITNIKTYLVDATWRNWVLVKVETDAGIHGWGEASMEMNEDIAPEAAIKRMSDYGPDHEKGDTFGKCLVAKSIRLYWNFLQN